MAQTVTTTRRKTTVGNARFGLKKIDANHRNDGPQPHDAHVTSSCQSVIEAFNDGSVG